MKDEIKEKIKAYYLGDDIDKVLDDITNLQEEKDKYKNVIDKIKEYINENEVCLIKNGIPEIKKNELIKLLEEVE